MTSPGEYRPDDGGGHRPPPPHPGPDAPAGRYGPTPYEPGGHEAPPYVYNPYGNVSYPSSYPVPPAGLGPDDGAGAPVRRPGAVHGALVLFLLAAVPYLLSGTLAVLGAAQIAQTAPGPQLDELRQLGVDPAEVVRAGGVVVLVVAVVFALLALLAWSGRRWARALVAAMTVGFVLLVLAVVVLSGQQGALDGASLVVVAGPAVLAVLGVVLMFGSAARAWFGRLRR